MKLLVTKHFSEIKEYKTIPHNREHKNVQTETAE